jgi:rare lipoprotein A
MLRIIIKYLYLMMFILVSSCSQHRFGVLPSVHAYQYSSYQIDGKRHRILKSGKNYEAKGLASWYGPRFHKKRTSSGERYNMHQLTAAHKTLPLFTRVLVTNLSNGKQVIVKINDRGPFIKNRIIDLSYAAAKKLGMVRGGTALVSIKTITYV